jgi:hypothetical protein
MQNWLLRLVDLKKSRNNRKAIIGHSHKTAKGINRFGTVLLPINEPTHEGKCHQGT